MLVVLVLVLGLAIFLASVMFKSAGQAAGAVDQKTGTVIAGADKTTPKLASGLTCSVDADCESGRCSANFCD